MKKREIYEFLYGFIDSKDIAEYLGEIEYSCDDLCEAAYIVQQSSFKTLDEKFEALDYLVDTMPDSSMPTRSMMEAVSSCKTLICDYKSVTEKCILHFYESEGCIYSYKYLSMPRSGISSCDNWWVGKFWNEPECTFDDLESAIDHYKRNVVVPCDSDVVFIKRPVFSAPETKNRDCSYLFMSHRMDGLETIFILPAVSDLDEAERVLLDKFRGMNFIFPLPFRRGDILIDNSLLLPQESYFSPNLCGLRTGPFVLDYISSWDVQTLLDNGFDERDPVVRSADKRLQDMRADWPSDSRNYTGYKLLSRGPGHRPNINYTFGRNILNLERYTGSLDKQWMGRVLNFLSDSVAYCPEKGEFRIPSDVLCNKCLDLFGDQMDSFEAAFLKSSLELHRGNALYWSDPLDL